MQVVEHKKEFRESLLTWYQAEKEIYLGGEHPTHTIFGYLK